MVHFLPVNRAVAGRWGHGQDFKVSLMNEKLPIRHCHISKSATIQVLKSLEQQQ
jgi:hypothetical protein